MTYCEAIFSRGAGLGTRLFPWARCIIFAYVNKIPMIAPQWVQPRIGPLLRGGIDLKSYHRQILLLGLFKAKREYINNILSCWLRYRARRIPEPNQIDSFYTDVNPGRNTIVTFEGDTGMFDVLCNWDEFLHQELLHITNAKWLRLVETYGQVPIGINVRLGNDFRKAKSSVDYYNKGAIKTPLSWYIDSLCLIRKQMGFPVKAIVTSDGSRNDLKELLDLDNVIFARPGCAISDLLLMARAKVFISAGGSSFSAWAAFLGQMPTISHPGQSLTWFKMKNRKGYYIGEFDPSLPNQLFLEQVQTILKESV